MKIAFDEHIPIAMVKVFQTLAGEYQLRQLTAGLQIQKAKDYAPKPGEKDYVRRSDAPWIRRFARAGGKIIISGDKKMKREYHERLALVEEGMVVVFFDNKWNDWKFCSKCALLLHWWPVVVKAVKKAKPATFWHIPCNWEFDGKLRQVPSEDLKRLKLERQLAAQPKVAAERKARRRKRPRLPGQKAFAFASNDGKDDGKGEG